MKFFSHFLKGNTVHKQGRTEAIFVLWIFQLLAVIIILGIAFLYGT